MNTYLSKPEGDTMAYSPKKRAYNIQYAKTHSKRVPLEVRKEYFENVLSRIPEVAGIPINTFIKAAITEKIQRDGLDLPIDEYKP